MSQDDQPDQHERLGLDGAQPDVAGEFGEGADDGDQGVEQCGSRLLPGDEAVTAGAGQQPQGARTADHGEEDEGTPPDPWLFDAADLGEQAHHGGQQKGQVDPADDTALGTVAHPVGMTLNDAPPQADQGETGGGEQRVEGTDIHE
ncbi:hypothetical protein [Streptomyces prasinus]